jgi:hypothetical protein
VDGNHACSVRCGREWVVRITHTANENGRGVMSNLKVPKREIFYRSDSPDFYTIKSSWVGGLLVKILTYYFNF